MLRGLLRFYCLLVFLQCNAQIDGANSRPNVLFIICDDLNDYVQGMDGHPQVKTPHLDEFRKAAVSFNNAHSNNPVCAPSRASLFTGIYPHTSGNLFWDKWFKNRTLSNSKSMMEYFRDQGYDVRGTGKLFHHHQRSIYSTYGYQADYGPFVYDGTIRVSHPSVPLPFREIGAVDGSFASLSDVPYANDTIKNSGWIYGGWGEVKSFRYVDEDNRDPTPDERNALWVRDQLNTLAKSPDSPFFLAVGFIRPHTPLHVPQKYFDLFPIDSVQTPVLKEEDNEDTHLKTVYDPNQKGFRYFRLIGESYTNQESGIRAFTQGYLASVAAVDDAIGEVLAGLDSAGLAENTIVIITSDHGWNMGEKDYLFKNSLWEESTRVPLMIRFPNAPENGKVCNEAVSLIDLYPTLTDLCEIEGDTRRNNLGAPLDGYSLRPFLYDVKSKNFQGPNAALTMAFAGSESNNELKKQHWSLRNRDFRYTLYANGREELYDHQKDPNEWTNLANDSNYELIRNQLKNQLYQRVFDEALITLDSTRPNEEPLVYPNPVKGIFTIEGVTIHKARILDNAGKELNMKILDSSSLDISFLSAGNYLLILETISGQTFSVRLQKQ